MLIVLEGPDASGKSTLANYLSIALDLPVQSSEGPPQYEGEMQERLARYEHLDDYIFDRHPCVSEEMYSFALRRPIAVTHDQVHKFYERRPVFIYCEPPASATLNQTHVLKPHDTVEHIQGVRENYDRLLTAYRDWAVQHAHIIYRIGDDMEKILHYLCDPVRDIEDFHHKFGIAYSGRPRHLDEDLENFRVKFLVEELCEYVGQTDTITKLIQAAIVTRPEDDAPPIMVDQFDALIDLAYVLFGTLHLHGFPFRQAWARVHRANMTKIRAPSAADSKRQHSSDVIKPPDFVPPDLSDLLYFTPMDQQLRQA